MGDIRSFASDEVGGFQTAGGPAGRSVSPWRALEYEHAAPTVRCRSARRKRGDFGAVDSNTESVINHWKNKMFKRICVIGSSLLLASGAMAETTSYKFDLSGKNISGQTPVAANLPYSNVPGYGYDSAPELKTADGSTLGDK